MANETKLAVILHADVAGSTALVQRDERVAHERIQAVFQRLSAAVGAAGGGTRELRGDALVAEFARASDAAVAALSFQQENDAANAALADEIVPRVRIGIALGEVVLADNTVTGAGVVLAQRIEQLAPPGGVCVSAAVRESIPGRFGYTFETLGEQQLKGFEYGQAVFRLLEHRASDEAGAGEVSARDTWDRVDTERASIAVLPFDNLSSARARVLCRRHGGGHDHRPTTTRGRRTA